MMMMIWTGQIGELRKVVIPMHHPFAFMHYLDRPNWKTLREGLDIICKRYKVAITWSKP